MEVAASILILAFAGAVVAFALGAAVLEQGSGRAPAVVFAAGWGVFVFIPLAWGMFGGQVAWYVAALGAYDFAGAIPLHLGAGVAAVAILILIPRVRAEFQWFRRLSGVPTGIALTAVAVAWIAWLALMELNLNELVIRIVATSAILAVGAVAGTLGVQLIRTGRVSLVGVAVGLVTGLVAATAACAFLESLAAAATGLIAGALSGAVTFGRKGTWMSSLAGMIASTNLSGAVVGLLMIGLLESGRGFFYTGAMTLLVAQTTVVIACLVYAALVSLMLGIVAGGHGRRARAARDSG